MEVNNRLVHADLCRFLACCGVILGHCSDGFVKNYIDLPLNEWLYSHFWGSLSRIASPLCILLSGSLLLKPNSNTITIYEVKRRLFRILIPLCTWVIVYITIIAWKQGYFLLDYNMQQLGHLWFILMMAGLYIFLPIFKILFDGLSKNPQMIYYFCFLWIVITCIPIHVNLEILGWIKQPTLFLYGGYFLIGSFAVHIVKDLWSFKMWVILYLSGFVFTFLSVWYSSFQANTTIITNYSLLGVNTAISAIAAFMLLLRVNRLPILLTKTLTFVSDKAFIIYFTHGLILHILYPILIEHKSYGVFLIPIWAAITFIICLGIATVLRYIPKSKLLFG